MCLCFCRGLPFRLAEMWALLLSLDLPCSMFTCGSGKSWTLRGRRSTWSWPRAPLSCSFQRSRVWSGWSSTSRVWRSRAMARRGAKVKSGHGLGCLPGPPVWRLHWLQARKMQDAYSLRSETGHRSRERRANKFTPRSLGRLACGSVHSLLTL